MLCIFFLMNYLKYCCVSVVVVQEANVQLHIGLF